MNELKGFDSGPTNYEDRDFARFPRRSFVRSKGISKELLTRPIVEIAMTSSGFNDCHRTMDDLVEACSRGVLAAGSLPIDFLVPESEVKRQLEAFPVPAMPKRGCRALNRRKVMQGPEDCDFDYLADIEE